MYATLSEGNSKLGAVPSVSLPPIVTCSKNLPCYKNCYALQQYKQYPNTRRAYDRNLRRWKSNPDRYFGSIIWQIRRKGIVLFRWHVSGDIPALSYIKGMIRVAEALPGTRFLVFTKRYDWVKGVQFPKNVSMVLSAWPGLPLPKTSLPIAFMCDESNPDPRIKNALSCPGGCESCAKCWLLQRLQKNVVFPLHSGAIASAKARKNRKSA